MNIHIFWADSGKCAICANMAHIPGSWHTFPGTVSLGELELPPSVRRGKEAAYGLYCDSRRLPLQAQSLKSVRLKGKQASG
jgi:hypothetical protein